MTDDDELVALFHSMDDEAQELTLASARVRAKRFPRARPALRLIAGQPGNRTLGGELGGVLDLDPTPVG